MAQIASFWSRPGERFLYFICENADNRLAAATVAKRVNLAKQVFRAAVRWGWLDGSPFDGLRAGSQSNPAWDRSIRLETIRDILDACPSIEWRLLVALARLAGLRCPSEIGAVTWADVNWEKGRRPSCAWRAHHHQSRPRILATAFPESPGVVRDRLR
jgi:integrase